MPGTAVEGVSRTTSKRETLLRRLSELPKGVVKTRLALEDAEAPAGP